MTRPVTSPHDDYIDRLNAEVERRLSYLEFAERAASPVLISDARTMLSNTLARLGHAVIERGR